MFEQILNMVKDHIGNDPQLSAAIPADQQEAVHNEIATHLANSIPAGTDPNAGGLGGLLSSIEGGLQGGGIANMIEGGLVSTLASKFGLPPEVTGAVSAALPGLIAKFTQKPA